MKLRSKDYTYLHSFSLEKLEEYAIFLYKSCRSSLHCMWGSWLMAAVCAYVDPRAIFLTILWVVLGGSWLRCSLGYLKTLQTITQYQFEKEAATLKQSE